MQKDAYYFPHFCNARHDRKIKRLRKELGTEGYGIFFMLLEVLREQIDFRYPMDDLDLLAEEFGTSEQKVRVVICNYALFEIHTENNKEMFFSPKLLTYLTPYINMKNQRIEAGKKSGEVRRLKALEKLSNERPFNGCSTDAERELNENEQSKVKKSKENIYSAFFENAWSVYPNKKGKGQVSKTQISKLEKIGIDEIKRCIERYVNDKEEWKQYQNGSTFFNSGYIDYLDKNYSKQQEQDKYRKVD